jgi:mitochondrial fission protein ELM1
MSALRHIRVLSDGRPGHENQSVGLALALAKRTGAAHEVLRIDPAASSWQRMKQASAAAPRTVDEWPDLIIAAGHRTHVPLWWAGRRLGAKTVVIMTPSLPLRAFDLALVPQHDAPGAVDTVRRILTKGALNRVPEDREAKTDLGLVLIGGPSKHHGWDGERLAGMVARVTAAQPDLSWTVADSRRTPAGFLEGLAVPGAVRKVPHQQTQPGWLAGELAKARVVWVTADSVSMVHEAATAGAATGVFPVPLADDGGGRPQRSVDTLIAEGLVTDFTAWERAGGPGLRLKPGVALHEAGRCADLIVARWFASPRA